MASVKTETKTKTKTKVAAQRQKIVRADLMKLDKTLETGYIDMAALLSESYHKEFYLEWNYTTFEDFCKAELKTHYRKAMNLVKIWDHVKGIKGITKTKLNKLGWTKLKELIKVIDAENFDDWFDKAENMSTREVIEAVAVSRKKDTKNAPTITTMSFKMPDQSASAVLDALSEAKKITENESDALALEFICQEWMTSQDAVPAARSIDDHIAYVERQYGVKLSAKDGKKTTTKKEPEADEETEESEDTEKKASGKKKTKKKTTKKTSTKKTKKKTTKKAEGDDSLDDDDPLGLGDIDEDDELPDVDTDETADEDEQSIADLLGLD